MKWPRDDEPISAISRYFNVNAKKKNSMAMALLANARPLADFTTDFLLKSRNGSSWSTLAVDRSFVEQRPLAETAYGLRRTLQRFAHSLTNAEICSHLGVSSWNFMAFWLTAYDLCETNAYKNAHSVPGGKRRVLTQTPARSVSESA